MKQVLATVGFLLLLAACCRPATGALADDGQPWIVDRVGIGTTVDGVADQYYVHKISSVILKGLAPDDHNVATLGLYRPYDLNGDGVVDTHDGKPVYQQEDETLTSPGVQTTRTGVVVGHYFMYWLKDAGGWAIHTSIGSEQVMMYFRDPYGDAAHELHHRQGWKKVVGGTNPGDLKAGYIATLQPDEAVYIVDTAASASPTGTGTGGDTSNGILPGEGGGGPELNFDQPGARLEHSRKRVPETQRVYEGYRDASMWPRGELCPSGSYRDGNRPCQRCPKGRYGESNELTSDEQCSACPAGKFGNKAGGASERDACSNCTLGKYGSYEGQTYCTFCPLGKYALTTGLTSAAECEGECVDGYRNPQCPGLGFRERRY